MPLNRIGYVEKMGTGLRRIEEECGKHRTELEIETNGYFIITFKPNKIITQKSSQKSSQKILDIISQNSQVTIEEIADALKITGRAIKKNIQKLKNDGLLKRIGPDKGGHWEVIER